MASIRENWRVILLVVVLMASVFALVSPTFDDSPAAVADDSATNLKYGVQIEGGTRIQAPLHGVTAEDVGIGNETFGTVEEAVAAEMENADAGDVSVVQTDAGTIAVEVRTNNATIEGLSSALDAAGYAYENVRTGVTGQTRQQAVEVLRNKINQAGLSGGTVQIIQAPNEQFVRVEVPNQNQAQVLDLIESRGQVQLDVYYRNGSGEYVRETAIRGESLEDVGIASQYSDQPGAYVPVAVNDSAATGFQQTMVDSGVAGPAGRSCNYAPEGNASTGACILLVNDGEVVNAFGMTQGLATSMQSGEWAQNPRFQLQAQNISEASEIALNLRAGTLPVELDLDRGTSSFFSSTQGESFKLDSLITGIIAVLAVSVVVFFRYGEARVALPMIVTAMSEVAILLGAAAAIGYPINLSVIGGFIAVIGTGVDDLIIIADEVMSEGDVSSRRVFQSRFRKAFWVIGAAAATTIVAMSPLAVLSLGDLSGFAIFTVLGVIVGVLLTRPAYGDILRALLTDR
jgi:preprotein translocase subunit SecD